MKQGVTVYLDVPLDALARRIAAVGTESRPLLHFDSGDAYTKVIICFLHTIQIGALSSGTCTMCSQISVYPVQVFVGLFTLSKKRAQSYASADVTVSVLGMLFF